MSKHRKLPKAELAALSELSYPMPTRNPTAEEHRELVKLYWHMKLRGNKGFYFLCNISFTLKLHEAEEYLNEARLIEGCEYAHYVTLGSALRALNNDIPWSITHNPAYQIPLRIIWLRKLIQFRTNSNS